MWKEDPRLAMAEDLCIAGHLVEHVLSDGSRERHARMDKMPDWLQGEEERLRKLEKQRQAGELKRAEKSAADRSTETVVSQLMRPAAEVDAIVALQEAETQPELQLVQQKIVRLQRKAANQVVPGKVLTHVPQFIKEETRAQADWIAQRKREKLEGKVDASSATASSSKSAEVDYALANASEDCQVQVECASCSVLYDWAHLQPGDGLCAVCYSSSSTAVTQPCSSQVALESSDAGLGLPEKDDLEVECQRCSKLCAWRVLALGDGQCPGCFEEQRIQEVGHSSHIATASSWRARRRQTAVS